ncbi:MAG: hydrogenase subunit MbhD domain-containing protein [Armatimonadota bacterium]|nr:hydrogenase subunit MbhD domain-containing protein [Armatimonadota bacterium]
MEAIQVLDWVALGLVVVLAVLAIHLRDLLKGALALAVLSAILAALFYRFGAPWAAMFELSVCAGFITVLFLAVIALTEAREQSD